MSMLNDCSRKAEVLDKVQDALSQASLKIASRMAKGIAVALNKAMSSYVDDVLAFRKMNFIDMVSVKHRSMGYREIQIGFEEELEARIEAQIEAISPAEWLIFQFRDAELFFEEGKEAVVASVKKDVLEAFGTLLDDHYKTKRMQLFLEHYPWLTR